MENILVEFGENFSIEEGRKVEEFKGTTSIGNLIKYSRDQLLNLNGSQSDLKSTTAILDALRAHNIEKGNAEYSRQPYPVKKTSPNPPTRSTARSLFPSSPTNSASNPQPKTPQTIPSMPYRPPLAQINNTPYRKPASSANKDHLAINPSASVFVPTRLNNENKHQNPNISQNSVQSITPLKNLSTKNQITPITFSIDDIKNQLSPKSSLNTTQKWEPIMQTPVKNAPALSPPITPRNTGLSPYSPEFSPQSLKEGLSPITFSLVTPKKNDMLLSPVKNSPGSPEVSPSKLSPSKIETDPHRLQQRQKQIDYGYKTLGYIRYRLMVPKETRTKEQPKTPRKSQSCSKRSWDGQVKKWRRELHLWDPTNPDECLAYFDDELLNRIFEGTLDIPSTKEQLEEQLDELRRIGHIPLSPAYPPASKQKVSPASKFAELRSATKNFSEIQEFSPRNKASTPENMVFAENTMSKQSIARILVFPQEC